MKAKTLIPEVALREAITNAAIHRKYSIPGATKIALYDDHLEIFSPGNFPGHVNVNNLGEGITHFRNPILGRMSHKMGIIEKLGSGIKLIFDSCKKAGIVAPIFREDGDYVKVIFQFEPLKNERKSDEEMLLILFKSSQTLTINDMIAYLGRSKNTTFKILHALIKKGLVKQIGKGKITRYSLNS
jgi:ATP-dependent DNA helicase RecG